MSFTVDGIILLVMSIILAITSTATLYLITKIEKRTRDIVYLILLSIVDLIPIVALIIYIILYYSYDKSPINDPSIKQAIGFFNMAWPFLNCTFTSCLASTRYRTVCKLKNPKKLLLVPITFSTIYFSLLIATALKGELIANETSIFVQAYPSTSILSACCLYFLVFSFVVGGLVSIICYSLIFRMANHSTLPFRFENLEANYSNTGFKSFTSIHSFTSVWLILFIYIFINLPVVLLLIVDATIEPLPYVSDITKTVIADLKVFLIYFGGIAYALVVLFKHPLIFSKFKEALHITWL